MSADSAETPVVACPQCGGRNELPSGERLVHCAFCGVSLYVERSGLFSHYLLPRRIDLAQAKESLRRWMAGNQTVKDLDSLATIGRVTPISFPMWLFRLSTPGGEEVVVEPAAPTPVAQLAELRVPPGKLRSFGDGEPGAETTAAAVPLDTARGWLGPRGAGQLRETALVHVPLWRCEYAFNGRPYVALVEGATGEVLAAVFPAKAEAPYLATAALGLLLFAVEGLFFPNPFIKLLVYSATAAPLLALAWRVTRRV